MDHNVGSFAPYREVGGMKSLTGKFTFVRGMDPVARAAARRRHDDFGLRGRRGADSDHAGADTGSDSDPDTDSDSDADAGADRTRYAREPPGFRYRLRLHRVGLDHG